MHLREHGKTACSAACRSSWIEGCRLRPRCCCSALGVVVWLRGNMSSRWIGDLQAKSHCKHLQIHKMLIAVYSSKRLKLHSIKKIILSVFYLHTQITSEISSPPRDKGVGGENWEPLNRGGLYKFLHRSIQKAHIITANWSAAALT